MTTEMDRGAPLLVEGLTKSYGPREILSKVSFEVPAGSIVGLLGPNGCGKTTTIRCALGLARPDAGQARVLGRPYSDLDHPGRHVGVVHENAGLNPRMTARQHVVVNAASLGIEAQPEPVLTSVGLGRAMNVRADRMSLGMRQRLALCLARMGGPELLILDEPANGLDPEAVVHLRSELRQYVSAGGSVLMTSHVLSELEHVLDTAVIMGAGRVYTVESRSGGWRPGELESLYLQTVRAGASAAAEDQLHEGSFR